MRSCFLLLVFFIMLGYSADAQNNQRMNMWQDSLRSVGVKMYQHVGEAERLESNFNFVKILVSALKEPNSYFFDFDKLDAISILRSPDDIFRVFSWSIPLQDGSYLYYGSIQHKVPGGKLKLTPLLDKTFEIKDPNTEQTSNSLWYGAQYYEIVRLSTDQYALLGWKGHHAEYSKKVIEILQVDPSGKVILGANIFSEDAKVTRKIFSYTKSARMYLAFNKAKNRIEFDHIVPLGANLEGNYKNYVPDLTHDSYEIKSGKLVFKENVEVNNSEIGDEQKYIDPLKPNAKNKSGF